MVYTYTPTYYTSLHDSITSICKTILPFSFKKRRIPAIAAAEQQLSKQQSDNLKWQQESFHQILNLIGLCREGIVAEYEVSAFRTHLLETLITSPVDREPPVVSRDKLIFLQELLYAKCISEEEYHASKRPLLQRLAVEGAEIDARDVIIAAQKEKNSNEEEWSVIDLKDDKCSNNHNISTLKKNHSKESSTVKRMKGAVSVFGFVTSDKIPNLKENDASNARDHNASAARNEVCSSRESSLLNDDLNNKVMGSKSILMEESLSPSCVMAEKERGKVKKKPSRTIFQREQGGDGGDGGSSGGDGGLNTEDREKVKPGKKLWILYGYKKWRRNDSDNETPPFSSLSLNEKLDEESYTMKLVENPIGEGPDTRQIKRKLHPNGAPTDFFVDKVLAENIKKRLNRIKTELAAKNQDNNHLTDGQIWVISTRLPVDKADLKMVFPKSWCDQYGDIVLDVVRNEFKNHMREMGNRRHKTFDDENSDPNHSRSPFIC